NSSLVFGFSHASASRSIPNVGQRGRGESKKCIGKLLQIPPSENQQRSASTLTWAPILLGFSEPSSSSDDRATVLLGKSGKYSGMALSKIGKLRLSRAATTIGKRMASGNSSNNFPSRE